MTRIANVVVAVMVAFPVMSLVQRELAVNAARRRPGRNCNPIAGFRAAVDTGLRPNIIHIVLDGYSRQDVLAELYGFDNAPFLDRLRELGFAVADRATTPYNQTLLVMDSVFSGTMLEGSERFGQPSSCATISGRSFGTIRSWRPCPASSTRPLPLMYATIRSGWISRSLAEHQ